MKVTVAAGEAVRSIRSSLGRNVLVMLSIACSFGVAGYLEASTASDLTESYRAAREHGSDVVVVSREDGGLLSGTVCESLGRNASARGSGSLTLGPLVEFSASPGVSLQSVMVSPGYLRLVDPAYAETGAAFAVAKDAASDMGLSRGSVVDATSGVTGALRVDAIINAELRVPAQGRWVYDITSSAQVGECWVEAKAGSRSEIVSVIRAAYSNYDDTRVAALVTDDSRSTLSGWPSRISRFAWAPAGIMASVVWLLVSFARRSEIGLRRSLGFSKAHVLLQLLLEYFILCLGASVIAGGWIFAALIGPGSWPSGKLPVVLGLRSSLEAVAMSMSLHFCFATVLVFGRVFNALRSR